MEFIKTAIEGLILIKPKVFGDERGFFVETYKQSLFSAYGICYEFLQDNYSKSVRGVLRGLHYQLNPKAQGKLVRCIRGAVYDVAVDIRKNSPTFGKYLGFNLESSNMHMLWIPPGFAHGFVTLSDIAEFSYKTTNEYVQELERGIYYKDETIGIKWPLEDGLVISAKDQVQPKIIEAENNF